jgi:hypothetical protein
MTESAGMSFLRAASSVTAGSDSWIADCPQLCPRTPKDKNTIDKDAMLDILEELRMTHATKGRRRRAIWDQFALGRV